MRDAGDQGRGRLFFQGVANEGVVVLNQITKLLTNHLQGDQVVGASLSVTGTVIIAEGRVGE